MQNKTICPRIREISRASPGIAGNIPYITPKGFDNSTQIPS